MAGLPKATPLRYYSNMYRVFAMIPVLLALVPAGPLAADVVGPGGKVQDCYCTDTSGGRVELGETICLYVDGRAFMAQCQMSLNVPMWREVQEGCLSSQVSPRLQSRQPSIDPVSVDPEIPSPKT